MSEPRADKRKGDLTVTALYTAQTWKWAELDGGELFGTWRGRDVFNATNLSLWIARAFRRRLPLLRHGLVQRHVIIDRMLAESGCAQVLELAAGLSRRGASVSADERVRYTEVDLPRVIEKKRALLARSARGREVAARDNLRMVGEDVRDVDLSALVDDGPVFVIAEGLLMYLDAGQQAALWKRIAALLAAHPGSAFAFDLVPFCEQPRPGAIGRSLQWLFERFTRGAKFAFDERTRDDIAAGLRDAGFSTVQTLEPATAPAHWKLPFANKRTQQLVWRAAI